MTLPYATIGHSTRSLEDFVALLQAAEIALLVDVRTVPRSRTNPQFNRDTLPEALAPSHIAYEHIATLGGLRGKSKSVAPGVNAMWKNASFHNFADYALTGEFRGGLDHLIALGRERRCAIMCSEAVWWRCHRRIIADHLIARGETVLHIMAKGRLDYARLTPGAAILPEGAIEYP